MRSSPLMCRDFPSRIGHFFQPCEGHLGECCAEEFRRKSFSAGKLRSMDIFLFARDFLRRSR
jgi:hypothetical protein